MFNIELFNNHNRFFYILLHDIITYLESILQPQI